MNEIYDWEDRVSINNPPQDRSNGYSGKNQHIVVGITRLKSAAYVSQREKFSSLNSLNTSFGKRY